jgi:hypothetical protein
LKFDYKLRSGLLSRSNALNIAHMLGIDTVAVEMRGVWEDVEKQEER